MKTKTLAMRSYKGAIKNLYYDYRISFKVCLIISAAIVLAVNFLNILAVVYQDHVNGNSNGGGMNIVGITALITILVSSIELTSKKNMESKFFFPLNKKIWCFANLTMMTFAAFVFTTMALMLAAIELIVGNILTASSGRFFFFSSFTWDSYVGGTITLFMFILVFGSFVYCLFIFLKRYLVLVLTLLGIVIILPIFSSTFAPIYYTVFKFFFVEQTRSLFVVKYLSLTLIFHTLAYLPLKKMEVVK